MQTGRIKSIIIDNQYIAIGVITVYSLISLINLFFFTFSGTLEGIADNCLPALFIFFFLIKDLPNGGSIGKKRNNLQVVNFSNPNYAATPWQCIIRNLTIFILPLEVLYFWFQKENRRIGDRIAGTQVVTYSSTRQVVFNRYSISISVLLSLAVSILTLLPIIFLLNLVNYSTRHSDSELNIDLSNKIKDELSSSLPRANNIAVEVFDRSIRGQNTLVLIKIKIDDINFTYRNEPLETELKNLCDKILIDTNYRAQCTIMYDTRHHKRSIGFSIR